MEQKIETNLSALWIIAFQLIALKFYYYENDIVNRQLIYQQSALRFHISLRETFSKRVSIRVMSKYDKIAVMQISQVFGTL